MAVSTRLVALECLGRAPGSRWLGAESATVRLWKIQDSASTLWLEHKLDNGLLRFEYNAPSFRRQWLCGNTNTGAVSLAIESDIGNVSADRWRIHPCPDGAVRLECQGESSAKRWLDANTIEGGVYLVSEHEKEIRTGTQWRVHDKRQLMVNQEPHNNIPMTTALVYEQIPPEDRRYLKTFAEEVRTSGSSGWLDSIEAGKRSGVDPEGGRRALRLSHVGLMKQRRQGLPEFSITESGMRALAGGEGSMTRSPDASREYVPSAISESIRLFRRDNPNPNASAFIMMQFGETRQYSQIVRAIRETLAKCSIVGLRADDKEYLDDVHWNVATYMHGCAFGVAVFENLDGTDTFNPNVAFEVGYMRALGKEVCLLKDKSVRSLHSDLIGKLFRKFDQARPTAGISVGLGRWMVDKGFAESAAFAAKKRCHRKRGAVAGRGDQPIHTIIFDYVDSPSRHGWVFGEGNEKRFALSGETDSNGGSALRFEATGRYAIDYSLPVAVRKARWMECVVRLPPQPGELPPEARPHIYVKVSGRFSLTESPVEKWFAMECGEGTPRRHSQNEWHVFVQPFELGDSWKVLRLNVQETVQGVLRNEGIELVDLIAVRIRGSLSVSRIQFT